MQWESHRPSVGVAFLILGCAGADLRGLKEGGETLMDANEAMEVVFFGVRGSRPVTGARHLKYGGNTACVAVRARGKWLLFDAGSGITHAAEALGDNGSIDLFLSHLHHDHVMGLMFFPAVHDRPADISIHLHASLMPSLEPYWSSPYFPIDRGKALAPLRLVPLQDDVCMVWDGGGWTPGDSTVDGDFLRIEAKRLPRTAHPSDGVVIYKVTDAGRTVVYATDVELADDEVAESVAKFARGASLLICDAHFTDVEYEVYRGWGHSSIGMAVDMARQADVERLALFHHAPHRDDVAMERLEQQARRAHARAFAAREGLRLIC